MSAPRIRIRPATERDAALIVHFVRELAKFEREPLENVKLTEADVLRDGFGTNPCFEALIAEHDSAPIGMALFFHNYSTWEARSGIYLEDLFVEERWRKHGVGRKLVTTLARIAKERGCRRFELSVLKTNPARNFYSHMGFKPTDNWMVYRLSGLEFDMAG